MIIDIDKCKSYNIYWIYDNIEDDHVSDNDDTSYFTKTYKKDKRYRQRIARAHINKEIFNSLDYYYIDLFLFQESLYMQSWNVSFFSFWVYSFMLVRPLVENKTQTTIYMVFKTFIGFHNFCITGST